MTFNSIQLATIRKIAEKYGVQEMEAAEQKGIFLDAKTRIIINCKVTSKEKEFKGLPEIGITDMKGFTDENAGGQTVDNIRDDIRSALKALPREKFKPKVEHDSAKQGQSYTAPKPPLGAVRNLHQMVEGTTACVHCGKPFDEWKNSHMEECTGVKKDDPKKEPEKSIPQIHNEEQNKTPEVVKPEEPASIKDAIEKDKKDHESKAPKAQDVSQTASKVQEPELKKTVPVKNCSVCGFALETKRAMECFEKDPQDPVFICEDCAEKNPEPKTPEVMPREPKGIGVVIPAKVVTSKGLRIRNIAQRFAEIGKIKIGRKGEKETASGYKLPEKFDHFEVVTPQRDANGQFIRDEVMSRLGESPKELKVMLLFDDESLNFPTSYREYKGGKCMCQGDGENAFDYRTGLTKPCDPDTCTTFKDKKCKLNGILSVILLDSPRIGGVYVLRTTSFNSVTSLMNSMMLIKTITGGILAMIPLTLTLTPKIVTPKGAEKAHTIYFVNIEYHGTNLLEKVIEVSKHRLAMHSEIQKLESQARQLQAAPESEEEIKDVEREFYPEVAK